MGQTMGQDKVQAMGRFNKIRIKAGRESGIRTFHYFPLQKEMERKGMEGKEK
jgi:hypothetical protein